jgi:hypothetical protein
MVIEAEVYLDTLRIGDYADTNFYSIDQWRKSTELEYTVTPNYSLDGCIRGQDDGQIFNLSDANGCLFGTYCVWESKG